MIFILVYIICTAISSILVYQFAINIPSMLMVFLVTSYAIIFFHIINYAIIGNTYRKMLKRRSDYAKVLISVAFMWLGSFLITIHYGASVLMFNFMGITSLYGALFTFVKTREVSELLKVFLIFVCLAIFYIYIYQYYSLIKYLGLLIGSLMTGTATFIYINQSHKLSQDKFTATEILACRYWLLWLIPLFFVIKDQEYLQFNFYVAWQTVLLGALSLILPVFFLQKSIESIGGNLSAILIGFTPFTTVILEKIILPHQEKNIMFGYLSMGLAFAISIPYITLFFKNRR